MNTDQVGEAGMSSGFAFVECTDVDDRTFDRFYHEVLKPAFPPEELVGLAALRSTYRTPLPGFYGTLVLHADEPVAGALWEYSAASGVMLLGYLAVRPVMRVHGLGSRLLAEQMPRWRETLRPTAILAEVEDPRCHGADEERGDPVARLRFYERMGARLLPLSYFQPSLGRGLSRVRGMFLISLDAQCQSVPVDALLTFLDEYVEECEGSAVRRTDQEYLALRDQVSSWQSEVPLWPMSCVPDVPRSAFDADTQIPGRR